ncbi:unnamed protein product [Durusdinium trenchii]|uniref:Uncharacterized protein n=1 Tax=Durusdinium trenchii TaxID=1381693 RepID=A0ABP0RQK7_9DINO
MAVLEMLLGDWREESSANQIQVTHNLEKGYQVLVQRPGRRRGRRFAAYVGSDGNVYRGCYVLDPTESTRDRQLWRLRSDLNEAASGHRCAWQSAKLGIVVGEHGLKLGDLAESIRVFWPSLIHCSTVACPCAS